VNGSVHVPRASVPVRRGAFVTLGVWVTIAIKKDITVCFLTTLCKTDDGYNRVVGKVLRGEVGDVKRPSRKRHQ